jgi:hypothetical protein
LRQATVAPTKVLSLRNYDAPVIRLDLFVEETPGMAEHQGEQ